MRGPIVVLAVALASACTVAQPASSPSPSIADEQNAQQAFSTFFELLYEGCYSQAAILYGGSYDSMRDNNPSLPSTDFAALMRNACEVNGVHCLVPMSITLKQAISADAFLFDVRFQNEDGTLFIRGPCCCASPTDQPPESVFSYRVIRSPQGRFLVTDMPPYVPLFGRADDRHRCPTTRWGPSLLPWRLCPLGAPAPSGRFTCQATSKRQLRPRRREAWNKTPSSAIAIQP